MTPHPFENPILRELARLINSGKDVSEIVIDRSTIPCNRLYFIILDENDHWLDVDLTKEGLNAALQDFRFWWEVMKRLKLEVRG